jgi:hypothetical protein
MNYHNHTYANAPLAVLSARIRRALSAGNSLHGMKFYESFQVRPEKSDDLPRVYITDYSDKEAHAGGAPQSGPVPNGFNTVIRQSSTIGLQLVVDSRNGWLTHADVDNVRKMGMLNIKNLLLDELERNDAGEVDCSLDGTLEKPIMFATRESGVFDLGIVMDITITLDPIRMDRSMRSRLIESQLPD